MAVRVIATEPHEVRIIRAGDDDFVRYRPDAGPELRRRDALMCGACGERGALDWARPFLAGLRNAAGLGAMAACTPGTVATLAGTSLAGSGSTRVLVNGTSTDVLDDRHRDKGRQLRLRARFERR